MLSGPSVDLNPWLACATMLTLRWSVVGIAWLWLFPFVGRAATAPGRLAGAACVSLWVGIVLSNLTAMLLAEAGLFRPWLDTLLVAALAAAGVGIGFWKARGEWWVAAKRGLPGLACVWAVSVVIMLLPRQGEWIVGGWDPGTYVDEGVWISQTGTFRPAPDPLFSAMPSDALPLFAPRVLNFTEGMPVFPMDPDTRSFEPFFFPFMPTVTAVLDRCGGLRAATRVNLWMGVFAGAMVLWAVAVCFQGRLFRVVAGLLIVLHPVWVYHMHFPTSELLQQGLLFGVVGLVASRQDSGIGVRWFVAAGLFALMATHLAAILFVSLLILALAWAELECPDRRRVCGARFCQIAGIVGGAGYDVYTSYVTVERLGFIMGPLLGISCLLLAGAVLLDRMGGGAWFERYCRPRLGGVAVTSLLVAFAALGIAAVLLKADALREQRASILGALPFLGVSLIGFSVPGLLLFVAKAPASRVGKALVFVALGATFMTLCESAIMPLYPWATRRFVLFTVPLLAILTASTTVQLRGVRWRPVYLGTGMLAGLLLLAALGPRTLRAWTVREYDGLSARLERLAGEFGPRDVVVADRFCYGIPLRFIHGKAVLNGERLVELTGADGIRRGVDVLKRLNDEGWRIRFLTSTAAGMSVFPFQVQALRRDYQSEAFVLNEVFHEVFVRDYALRQMDRQFAIWTWEPAATSWLEDGLGTNVFGSVDVGAATDAWWVASGFHGRESLEEGTTVRWTSGNAVLALPDAVQGHTLAVVVDYVDKHRPASEPAEPVELWFNGERLEATKTVSAEGARISARVPVRLNGYSAPRLGIRCKAWVPAVTDPTCPDKRALGVMVDRVSYGVVEESGEGGAGFDPPR